MLEVLHLPVRRCMSLSFLGFIGLDHCTLKSRAPGLPNRHASYLPPN
jgi:hypothetical protein